MRSLGRIAAILAAGSAAVHLTLAAEAVDRSVVTAVLLTLMSSLCLACLPAIWRGGSARTWMTMLGLTSLMLYSHLEFCFTCGPDIHDAADLQVGFGIRLWGQGLGSLALWLMAAEMAFAVVAIVRLLARPTTNHPEVAHP